LSLVVPAGQIVVLPPRDPAELEFDGLTNSQEIETRLINIAAAKFADVTDQIALTVSDHDAGPTRVIIAADTTIIVRKTDGSLGVIGQPPPYESWKDVVRGWFRNHFAGRTHTALTSLHVGIFGGAVVRRIARTEVGFIPDVDANLEWYLASGEPRGKAGGYALQGAGSIFVSHVTGSLSNVIGLPLEALLSCFQELKIDVAGNS
jgi:septum formation protein